MATRKPISQSDAPPKSAWNEGPWNEIAGILLFGVGLVIILALISYTADDPSWNSTGKYDRAHNWIGPVGAIIGDLLYQTLGLASMSVPLIFFWAGWWQWQNERPAIDKSKAFGIFLMIVAITGVLTLLGSETPKSYYLGGFVGRWLVYAPKLGLSYLLGTIGAIVAILVLFITGLVIGTEFSIVSVLVRKEEEEPGPGVLSTLGDRVRTWRLDRDTVRGNKETADQLREKMRQRNRPPAVRAAAAAAGKEVAVAKAPAGRGRNAAVPPPQIERMPAQYPEEPLESPAELEAEYSELEGESAVPEYGAPEFTEPRAAAAMIAPAEPLPPKLPPPPPPPPSPPPRSSRASREPAVPEEPDSYSDGDLPVSDFEEASSAGSRTIDEMMATASVIRPAPVEEKTNSKSKSGKAVTATSQISPDYKFPSTEVLTPPAPRSEMEEAELLERARQLAEKCAEFNVSGQVKQISPGPVVTTFEFKPDPGVKYSRVTSLVDDLCLGLKAESIRIDRIPGKSTVGIEVPNTNRETIRLREVVESKKFRESGSKLTLALGKTIDGSNYVADLAKMPHLLIAGATGAGKSVMLNAVLVSLLYKSSPDEVKMILVDPKRLELGLYADLPHLLTPIVTDPKRAGYALKWAVSEMENRYKHLAAFGVRNIEQYNSEVCNNRNQPADDADPPKTLPYIVVIIDELADLMMIAARDVEESITRLAQMARAVGIHLILATQRPSVDVITGLIKANFPSRISFRVSSKVDSRTIVDTNGAEQLLGQGDMLFLPPGTSRLVRVHGAYVDEKEVKRICDFIRSQAKPAYDEKVVMSDKEAEGNDMGEMARDDKYDDALRIVLQSRKASTSLLQRHLRIGYGRAASIIDMMQREGIVGPEDGSKPRQVLVASDFLERLDQMREENS